MILFDEFETYTRDLPLLKELGLKPFKGKTWDTIFVGKVTFEDGSHASIWVTGAPAQFWKFVIFCAENSTTYEFGTGSGSLSEYWPMAKAVAENCFVLKDIVKPASETGDVENPRPADKSVGQIGVYCETSNGYIVRQFSTGRLAPAAWEPRQVLTINGQRYTITGRTDSTAEGWTRFDVLPDVPLPEWVETYPKEPVGRLTAGACGELYLINAPTPHSA